MSLTFNENTGDYVLASNDEDRAKEVGLTLASKIRSQLGEKIWFTKTPYAALPFWDEADIKARTKLEGLYNDYQASSADTSDEDYPSPEGRDYLPYQRAGITYALGRRHCLIGDEPGLGKTIQAIGIANAINAERILVVCPASVRLHWQREVRGWSLIPRVSTNPILKSSFGVNPDSHWTIVSYDLARNEAIHKALCMMEWDLLILDEAHYLKTTDAKRTRAVFGGGRGRFRTEWLESRAKKIIGLTGTPLPNRPRECYTLAKAMCWESIDWATYDDFCYRFNPSGMTQTGFRLEREGRLPELQARLRANFMVRRLKQDVLTDLPDKRYEISYVEANGKIREILAKERMIGFNISDLKDPFDAEFWGQVSTVRREMGEAMAPRVAEHIQFLLKIVGIPKLVLFAHHRSVMDCLANELSEHGVVMVRGGMSAHAKDEAIQEFQLGDRPRIFLGQMQAAGEGIDGLQNMASHVVFAEPSWVPKDNEQCVDRCHRIGQHDNVVAQLMMVEGSIAERILATTIDKTHVIHGVLDKGFGLSVM